MLSLLLRHVGADRLTQREAELCSSARLLPIHYLSLKDVMMRDAQVHGHISRHDVSGGRLKVAELHGTPGFEYVGKGCAGLC